MANEDQVRDIELSESKIKKLELLIALFNNADFSDEELIKEGNNGNYLIYDFKAQKFEFVAIEKSKKEEYSVPYKNLSEGNRGCLKYWKDYIRQLESVITLLRTNFN